MSYDAVCLFLAFFSSRHTRKGEEILAATRLWAENVAMNSFFAELGRSVAARWKAVNFSPSAFPSIAQAALVERPPSEHVDMSALVRDFLFEDAQPFQTLSGFGQPELVVYDDPRFYIQLLFWMDGTTDIHQHMFSGAFHVLGGSSIHSQFVFEAAATVSAHLRVGNLRMSHTELLEAGRTVPIVGGREFIHALFHLETPSLTVVVRTHNDPGVGPQFTYLPPHLAVDPTHYDALTMRRKQLLDVLEATGEPSYGELVREMLGELDFERGFFILQNGIGCLRNTGEWDKTWAVFRKRHGKLAEKVAPTLDEIVRRDGLAALRATITEVEHRFFLALLLNVQGRKELLGMVGQRYEGRAEDTVLRWAGELIECTEAGSWLVDAHFPGESAEAVLAALRQSLGRGGRKRRSPRSAGFEHSSLRVLVE